MMLLLFFVCVTTLLLVFPQNRTAHDDDATKTFLSIIKNRAMRHLIKMIIPTTAILMVSITPTAFAQQNLRGLRLRDRIGARAGSLFGGRFGGGAAGAVGKSEGVGDIPGLGSFEFVDSICKGFNPTPRCGLGIYVCRTHNNDKDGTEDPQTMSRTMCIPEDRGIEGDICGCCEPDGCPEPPESQGNYGLFDFVDNICKGVTPAPSCDNGIYVCRTHTNDKDGTQDPQIMTRTVCIPEDRAIVGDSCGCCEPEGCPESNTKPENEGSGNEQPGTGAQSDIRGDDVCEGTPTPCNQGIYVCRTHVNSKDGTEDPQIMKRTMCISEDSVIEGDMCGCCDPDRCPRLQSLGSENPGGDYVEFVDTICKGLDPIPCQLSGNAATEGIFVCRTHNNDKDGTIDPQIMTRTMCIPEDEGIEGEDTCGCCDPNDCPVPCDCPCTLMDSMGMPQLDENGISLVGALVTMEGMESDMCVPRFSSAVMIERSEGSITCSPCA